MKTSSILSFYKTQKKIDFTAKYIIALYVSCTDILSEKEKKKSKKKSRKKRFQLKTIARNIKKINK